MARRLALLTLLACAAAVRRPPRHSADISDSESLDPFSVWDEYEDSYETTPVPRTRTTTLSAKVLLKGKIPKVNVTMKNTKGEEKKVIKTTNINIESHTNFIVTKPPQLKPDSATGLPVLQIGDQYVLVESPDLQQVPRTTTRRPSTTRRPGRRPSTTRRPPTTPRRPTTRPMRRTPKTTKSPQSKKTTCPPKNSGWLSSFFEENKLKKVPERPGKAEKSAKKSLKKTYKGFQLLRTYPDVQWKVHEMLDLQEEAQGSGLMWWTPPSLNGSTDLLVPPDLLSDVKDHLKSNKIDYDIIIWDLQKAITYENPRLSKKQRLELEQLRGHPMTWRRYHRYADILRYLEYLQHSHSDLVELIPLGRSSEGLPLVAVKVSLSVNDTVIKGKEKKKWKLRSRMKPAVWVDGGAHAREWIAPAVATWMIHALVEGEKDLGAEYDLLKQADFYIMPVLNPDGYEHSHTHDRLWRKTRSRQPDHSDDYYDPSVRRVAFRACLKKPIDHHRRGPKGLMFSRGCGVSAMRHRDLGAEGTRGFPWNWGQTECVGVDADRNWDYHWSEKDSSLDPCSENYAGPHPFSEPETRAVSEFLSEHRGQIKLYLSLHAYSQAWLVPSSHSRESFSDDGVLTEMGKLATVALADLYGTKYQVGTAAEIRQPASGMSHDWAKARAGIKFSYHVDLRDSFGPYGFLLPGSQIVSTARETWQAVKAIVDNLSVA
ncbi:unnamed protein product [Spodoptera exigua]|nr:unnamed protein product [Spodoptera exigua]